MRKKIIFYLLSLLFFLMSILPNHGTANSFYQGKPLNLIVPTKPGGGFDFYARLTAKCMQEDLVGSTIIIKYVPGAGHLIGVNKMYMSKPDGLTFAIFNPGVIVPQLVQMKGVKYDVTKMSWIGVTGIGPQALIMAPRIGQRMEDLKKAEVIRLATGGLGTATDILANLFGPLTGLENVKVSTGYRGSEAELAMMRGEVDGQFASWSSVSSFVKDGNAVPVVFVGVKPEGYENVPRLEEIVPEKKYEPLIAFLNGVASLLLRSFAGPPGIPSDRLEILRESFQKAVQSPQFTDIAKKIDRPAGYFSPKEIEALLNTLMKLSPEMKELIIVAYGLKK